MVSDKQGHAGVFPRNDKIMAGLKVGRQRFFDQRRNAGRNAFQSVFHMDLVWRRQNNAVRPVPFHRPGRGAVAGLGRCGLPGRGRHSRGR